VVRTSTPTRARDIAHLLDCSQGYVRGMIHDFNDIGFKALEPE
jgi:hypothetical protein